MAARKITFNVKCQQIYCDDDAITTDIGSFPLCKQHAREYGLLLTELNRINMETNKWFREKVIELMSKRPSWIEE